MPKKDAGQYRHFFMAAGFTRYKSFHNAAVRGSRNGINKSKMVREDTNHGSVRTRTMAALVMVREDKNLDTGSWVTEDGEPTIGFEPTTLSLRMKCSAS